MLDIGAWDGFFSFEPERRGAAHVFAADHFSWHGVGWGTGQGKAGFELARTALGSHVEDVDVDVMDLSPTTVGGPFDVVLFLGVLYHLRHPFFALERVASVTRGLLILETVVDMLGMSRPAVAFYSDRELNNDPTNWWGPNPAAVAGMLRAVGFASVSQVTPTPRGTASRRARAVAPRKRKKHGHVRAPPGPRGLSRTKSLISQAAPRSDFDLNLHTRIDQSGGDHHGRRPGLAEILAQHRPALLKFLGLRHNVRDSHDIVEARASLGERRLDIAKALLGLLDDAVGERHRGVIESRGARDKDPVAVYDRARIGNVTLERRSGTNQLSHRCDRSKE